MPKALWDRLRGARGIEYLALLALAALLALILLRSGGGHNPEKTDLESRLERILSGIDGAGSVQVMVTEDGGGNITGALVVAEELEDATAYLNLLNAVTTLLDVESGQVEIIGRAGCFGGWQ